MQSSAPVASPWKLVTREGPQLVYHTGGCIGGTLYIHGGIAPRTSESQTSSSSQPTNRFYTYHPDQKVFEEITSPGSPFLSHHACAVAEDRFLILIGGWTGKCRTSDVCIFDTVDSSWKRPGTEGFSSGAGLSSHTVTPLPDSTFLVIGREGSLRMQRRSGNAFILSGSPHRGKFTYNDYPTTVDSRSGHTVSPIGKQLITIGGRNDKLVDMVSLSGLKGPMQTRPPHFNVDKLQESVIKVFTKCTKPPVGRKHHVAVTLDKFVLVHGGETFDGKSKFPVSDLLILDCSGKDKKDWYRLIPGSVGRAGHIMVFIGGKVLIHGGMGEGGQTFGEVYELSL